MNFNIGDNVRFLNDVGGGVITKIIDKNHVMVENETGFDVPVSVREIIKIDTPEISKPSPSSNEEDNNQTTEETPINLDNLFYPDVVEVEENKDNINLYFAFVPQERPGNSNLDLYLINDSNYNVLYNIINKDALGNTFSSGVGVLEANTKIQTDTFVLQAVNEMPEYIFHCSFYKKGNFNIKQPLVKSVKINPIRFYKEKAYLENDFFNEHSIIIPLDNEKVNYEQTNLNAKDIEKIIKEKEAKEHKPKAKSRKEQEQKIVETDLHINELLDDCRGLSNGEILEIQLNKFHEVLKQALKDGTKKLVFIHGVGNGTLKTEVRKALDKKKDKLSYHDASFKEYGYGATMVKIR